MRCVPFAKNVNKWAADSIMIKIVERCQFHLGQRKTAKSLNSVSSGKKKQHRNEKKNYYFPSSLCALFFPDLASNGNNWIFNARNKYTNFVAMWHPINNNKILTISTLLSMTMILCNYPNKHLSNHFYGSFDKRTTQ